MKHRQVGCVAIATGIVLAALGPAVAGATPDSAHVRARAGDLRLPFIENQGQVDAKVVFYAPTSGGTMFVTREGDLVYSLPAPPAAGAIRGRRASAPREGWTLRERLVGGRARPAGAATSPTGVGYFLGADSARWRPRVPTYDSLGLGEVWPGVDVSLHAHAKGVEKVFTVSPGASVAAIRVRVDGATALAARPDGALVARTGLGPVTLSPPIAYQEGNGVRRAIAVSYRVVGREYGFTVGAHDPALPLVIDPLVQSTYLGGTGADSVYDMAIHPLNGDVYISGRTSSTAFPHTVGGARPTPGSGDDAFVARLTPSLKSIVQATYFGGNAVDYGAAIAIHPTTGDVYVAGDTDSSDLPGAAGGARPTLSGTRDGFVARFSSTLTSLVQATYLGGSGSDEEIAAMAIHPTNGDVYVAGATDSASFPGTTGGAQRILSGIRDGFVTRLASSLTTVIQSTLYGGNGDDRIFALAIHPVTGHVYVAGQTDSTDLPMTSGGAQSVPGGGTGDGYVARFTGSLTSLTQATYLGGSAFDYAAAIALQAATGDVYVGGGTESANFPATGGGAQPAAGGKMDGFVARLSGSLNSLAQATYLGGSVNDQVQDIAIHPDTGDVYAVGWGASANFPRTAGGVQSIPGGGGNDGFVARLDASLAAFIQATYFGGGGGDFANRVAVHPASGDVYVGGVTNSTDLPGAAGGAQPALAGGTDAFVARLTFGLAQVDPALVVSAIVNQPTFSVGQIVAAGGGVVNPGVPGLADFYVGLARPDGSIQFFTNAGTPIGNVNNVASFRPLAVAVPLATPFSVSLPTFYLHGLTASDMHGSYVFFVAVVKTGALAGGTIPADQIIGLATAPFSYP